MMIQMSASDRYTLLLCFLDMSSNYAICSELNKQDKHKCTCTHSTHIHAFEHKTKIGRTDNRSLHSNI